jgi:autotransporter translocation and assembly factor TamB
VSWNDVDAVYTGSRLPSFEHLSPIVFSGYSDGVVRFGGDGNRPIWDARTEVLTESPAGNIHADVDLALGGDPFVTLDGTVLSSSLDVGTISQNSAWTSDVSGRATITASGQDLLTAAGELAISLDGSRLAGRAVDTLQIDLAGADGHISGSMMAARGTGSLRTRLTAEIDDESSRYVATGVLSRFDIGSALLSDSLASSLNLRFEVDGTGNSLEAFEGHASVVFDSSEVTFADHARTVAPHRTTLMVRQLGSDSPVVEVSGDALYLRVTGDVAIDPFVALSRYWVGAFARSASDAFAKPLRPIAAEADVTGSSVLDLAVPPPLHDDAVSELERVGLSRQSIKADIRILRGDILSSLFPITPFVHTSAEGRVELTFDEQDFDLAAELSADSITSGSLEARGVTFSIEAKGSLQDLIADNFASDVRIGAQRLRYGDHVFHAPDLSASVHDQGIDLEVHSTSPGTNAPLRLGARMDFLEDRNLLHLKELQIAARDQVWRADSANTIDVYQDAVVVRDVTIRRTDAGLTGHEQIRLRGTLSPSPTDTLYVDAREIELQQIAALLAVDRPIGGAMNGRLAYTGFMRRPELTGELEVDAFTYDDRVLGSVQLASRYIPGSPDVALNVHLSPVERPDGDGRLYEDNDLAVNGTFRLPGLETTGARDEGALDLRLNVDKLDAFFLEYIFREEIENVDGLFAGSGRITGTFSRPIFEADLEVTEGGFGVPDFNLAYTVAGRVSVDEAGIHLDDVQLTDPTNGKASVSGSILFNDYRYFSFDLRGDLDEVRIMNVAQSRDLPFYGRIWVSGHATLSGPLSNTFLAIDNAVASPESDLYIPITETNDVADSGFIVFADSAGNIPNIYRLTTREHLLAQRPAGERPFLEGMEMDLNITAPQGSTVHLVIDPLLGDEINAVGSGRIELIRTEGEFFTFGTFDVDSGDYLFTAGDVFYRRFLIDDGSITWDGDPLNAVLDIQASYRTRASTEGLITDGESRLIPLIIKMNVLGRVATPSVELSLAVDRDDRSILGGYEGLEAELNQPELTAQYATSVLLTNSFLLTTTSLGSHQSQGLSDTRNQLAFNSLSQLVASQLNRYLNYAVPNLDLNLGVQGESAQDLDVTYGVALRLLDERLIIRGQGIYRNEPTGRRQQQSGLDEFVVEVRLNPNVSVEVFYRREGDLLSASESFNTSTGAGVSYQTQFTSWNGFMKRLFGWLLPEESSDGSEDEDDETHHDQDGEADEEEGEEDPDEGVVAGRGD